MRGKLIAWVNGYLPPNRQFAAMRPEYHNILLIAATNRGDSSIPRCCVPGGSIGACTSTCPRSRSVAT